MSRWQERSAGDESGSVSLCSSCRPVLDSGSDRGVAAAALLLHNSALHYVTFWSKKIRGFLLIFSLKRKRRFVLFND
jgi:hypothetical protein